MTDPARASIADGLRALADVIAANPTLPLGEYAASGYDIHVSATHAADVIRAAMIQDSRVDQHRDVGRSLHTTTTLRFGLVRVHVYHIAAAEAPLRMVSGVPL